MNSVNAVQLLVVVWSFAGCQVNADDFSVSCDDVTGTVGNEVTFTCSISEQCSEFCIKYYNFKYPEIYNESRICEEKIYDCEQRSSFTCRYTPTSAMKENFRFFIQTTCGHKTAEFTVEISGVPIVVGIADTSTEEHQDRGFNFAVISAVVSCVIIVIMAIIYKIKRKTFLGLGHDGSRYAVLIQQH